MEYQQYQTNNYNVRLHGRWPMIEADAPRMGLAMDVPGTASTTRGDCTLTIYRHSNAALVLDALTDGGACLSCTDVALSNATPRPEPYLSFRTGRDVERMCISSNGVTIGRLDADVYANLVNEGYTAGDYSVFRPPSANALTTAYITLSNMITVTAVGQLGLSNFDAPGQLLDTFTSTSVLNAPTANALRGAYYNLSNLLAVKLEQLPASGNTYVYIDGGACNVEPSNITINNSYATGTSGTVLSNDTWLPSLQDDQPRFFFATGGETVFAASEAFRWFDNEMQQDLMSLTKEGRLAVGSDVAVGRDLLLGPSARLSFSGSNVGLNLPQGEAPGCALHVNGAVYATEQVYALSDRRSKNSVRRIAGALARLRRVPGCTYGRPGTAQRFAGVMAQDVQRVLPEAVRVDPTDGSLSVCYGSLVALAIQGINELSRRHQPPPRRRCLGSTMS